jgi:streptogramin lyase
VEEQETRRRAKLIEWNLDPFDFRCTISIEPAVHCTAKATRGSLYFCGNRLSDFHGLLVNMEPRCDRFRLWDLDAGEAEGRGARFLAQHGRYVWVSTFANALHLLNPSSRRRTTYGLSFTPTGLALVDGTVMTLSSGTPGSVHRLRPDTGRLQSWTLPEEEVPFSGVAAPDGSFYFAERRLSRIARFLPSGGLLSEWQLPGFNPQVISRDALGRIWVSDANFNNRVGRLDPRRNRLAIFAKEGVVTFSVRPVDRGRWGRVAAAADLASYVDVVSGSGVAEVRAPVTHTPLTVSEVQVRRSLARAPVRTHEIPATVRVAEPVDPPGILRYPLPIPPIDLTEQEGVLFVTAGTFNERTGPSRIFALKGWSRHSDWR